MANENKVVHGHHRGDACFFNADGQLVAEAVIEVKMAFLHFFCDAESAPKGSHEIVAGLNDNGVFRAGETDVWVYLWSKQIQLGVREMRGNNTNRVATVVAQAAMVVESPFCIVSYSHFVFMTVLISFSFPMN